jgi:hypothetical protein
LGGEEIVLGGDFAVFGKSKKSSLGAPFLARLLREKWGFF